MDRIICVVGPTASGKTKLAVQLAKLYDGEVVSCDSMQIYKHMDIGTAKPTKEEMEGVHHHLLDMVEPGEDFSAGKYVQLADSCVQDILSRGKTAVIAGGTGGNEYERCQMLDPVKPVTTFAPSFCAALAVSFISSAARRLTPAGSPSPQTCGGRMARCRASIVSSTACPTR